MGNVIVDEIKRIINVDEIKHIINVGHTKATQQRLTNYVERKGNFDMGMFPKKIQNWRMVVAQKI